MNHDTQISLAAAEVRRLSREGRVGSVEFAQLVISTYLGDEPLYRLDPHGYDDADCIVGFDGLGEQYGDWTKIWPVSS